MDGDDAVSLVAFLRGPLNGSDDQALFDFKQAGGRFRLHAELPSECDVRITRAMMLLREAAGWARSLPPAAALARVFDCLGLSALAASLPRGEMRSGNLQKVLSIARRMSAEGASFGDVVQELDRMVAAWKCDIEEMSIDLARTDVVRLMNVHQAKGLEAGVVFLIDPVDPKIWPVDMHIDRDGAVALGYFPIPRPKRESTVKTFAPPKPLGMPPDWEIHEPVERDFEQREEERLLYVAATRAKNLLVIGVQRTATKWSGPWSRLASAALRPLFGHAKSADAPAEASTLLESFDAARSDLRARKADAHEESYAVTLVTKIAHSDGAELVKHEEGYGRGTSWGRVMHRLFDAMLRNPAIDVRRYAANLLKDEEREVAEIEDVLRVVEAVRVSEIWHRAVNADERLMEVPFALLASGADLGLGEAGDVLLHGVVDLVFREGEQWFVVDYKSDSTRGRLDALVHYYRPQVEHYARLWQTLTKQRATGGLFFVDAPQMVWL